MQTKSNFFLALMGSLTLGLAPFYPEPHIVGKIRWVMGGAEGMQIMDYGDMLMHGLPWVFLIYFTFKLFQSRNTVNMNIQNLLSDPSVTIVDVREVGEFKSGHIPNAKNIPLSIIRNKVQDFKKMNGPVVLYCRSGNRSGQAEGFLRAQGMQNVFNGGALSEIKQALSQAAISLNNG